MKYKIIWIKQRENKFEACCNVLDDEDNLIIGNAIVDLGTESVTDKDVEKLRTIFEEKVYPNFEEREEVVHLVECPACLGTGHIEEVLGG